MVRLQVMAVPVQAPLQPLNVPPAGGVAVRVTVVPLAMLAEQAVPQLIPPVLEVTVPPPVVVTTPLPLPVHAPLQPVKVDVPLGVAVRVTGVPLAMVAEQVLPQLMLPE